MIIRKQKNPDFKYMLGNINLLDTKYEKPNGGQVQELLANQKIHALGKIPKGLRDNFNAFSDEYLINLYCRSYVYVNVNPGIEVGLSDKQFEVYLRSYLTFQRNVDVTKEFRNWVSQLKKKHPNKKLKEILTSVKKNGKSLMDKFKNKPNESLKDDLKNKPNQAEYAVYQVAKFFGYHGSAKEAALAKFFDQKHANVFGFYCAKGVWYTNDNYGLDEKAGSPLTVATVKNILNEFEGDNWRDNFATRSTAIVDLGKDDTFKSQAQDIRSLLEKGLSKKLPQAKKLKPVELNPQNDWQIS